MNDSLGLRRRSCSFVCSHTNTSFSTTVRLESVSSTGIANVVELGDYRGEEDEGCTSRKNSFSHILAGWRVITIEKGSVLGMVSIPH